MTECTVALSLTRTKSTVKYFEGTTHTKQAHESFVNGILSLITHLLLSIHDTLSPSTLHTTT
jgi:hypothetical protein